MFKEWKSMKIAKNCPACDSKIFTTTPAVLMPFVAKRVFGWDTIQTEDLTAYSICNTMRCLSCGMVFCDIRFDDDETAKLYANYWGKEYTAMREKYERGYGERVWRIASGIDRIPAMEWFIEPHIKLPVDILDWGGDTGSNTPFRDKSKKLHIYEIGDNPVLYGERVNVPQPPYDLIVLSNVLEHASYPADIIMDITKVIGDALLYIEVPFVPSEIRSKTYWHEHINFFTEEAMNQMTARCGLKIVSARQIPPYYQVLCKK
jgi:hypothetical protein